MMNGNNYDEGKELLQAHAHIWKHISNFISSMCLYCAVRLDIPDIINNHPQKPITLSELAKELQIPEPKSAFLFRLMRCLVHSGFFALQRNHETQEEGYVLTPSCKLLLKSHPSSLSPYFQFISDPIFITPWFHIHDWFQSTNAMITPFEATHGTSCFQYLGANPRLGKVFDDAMASDARLVINVVLKECKKKFEGLKSLVDVGGGTGNIGRAICDAFPEIKCTVFDLPQVVGSLEGTKNLEFVSGDMFQSIPSADVVLLKSVMHDWSDEECVNILKRSREAIPSKEQGGKVIIIDMVVDDTKGTNESTETQILFDIAMMVTSTGKERTETEWKKLFFDAGFSSYKIYPVLGLRSFIEVFP